MSGTVGRMSVQPAGSPDPAEAFEVIHLGGEACLSPADVSAETPAAIAWDVSAETSGSPTGILGALAAVGGAAFILARRTDPGEQRAPCRCAPHVLPAMPRKTTSARLRRRTLASSSTPTFVPSLDRRTVVTLSTMIRLGPAKPLP